MVNQLNNNQIFDFIIVGFRFNNVEPTIIVNHLGNIRLEQEQNNQYDSNAVAVYLSENKVAYVSRNHNQQIKNIIQNHQYTITVVDVYQASAKLRLHITQEQQQQQQQQQDQEQESE